MVRVSRGIVSYKFQCSYGDCTLHLLYTGMTTTKLSHLSGHLQSGSPKTHLTPCHYTTLSRKMLEKGTITDTSPNPRQPQILEALYTEENLPNMSSQADNLVLPSTQHLTYLSKSETRTGYVT